MTQPHFTLTFDTQFMEFTLSCQELDWTLTIMYDKQYRLIIKSKKIRVLSFSNTAHDSTVTSSMINNKEDTFQFLNRQEYLFSFPYCIFTTTFQILIYRRVLLKLALQNLMKVTKRHRIPLKDNLNCVEILFRKIKATEYYRVLE